MTIALCLYAMHQTAALAVAVCGLYRAALPTGRHRAPGRMSWPDHIALGASNEVSRIRRAAYRALLVQPVLAFPELRAQPDEAPLCPPMYPRYSGYQLLKPRVMEAQAHVDVTALRLRGSVPPVVEVDDVAYAAVA